VNNGHIQIAPSILSADFRCLEREVKSAQDAGADRIHCDVMDGHFVPNITFGPLVVEAVRKCVSIPLDVHLMISEPLRYVKAFCNAGADILIFHAEANDPVPETADAIRKCGVKAGITVNPDKPVELFLEYLDKIDQVLIMTVYAGFGGQKFIHGMTEKMKRVYEESKRRGLNIDIEVDGGVNRETAAVCARNGANVFVAGSFVFGSDNYAERIDVLRISAQMGAKECE